MSSSYFRRRPIGRASSPPTWACYEQILHDDQSSEDSCSEDDEEYHRVEDDDKAEAHHHHHHHDHDMHHEDHDDDDEREDEKAMDVDVKGKGKEKESGPIPVPVSASEREGRRLRRREERERRRRDRPVMLRPILTIQRSGGFVWNQDLFVPAYCKDRYIASTSPPTSHSPFNNADYETVEVVEIRVEEGEGVLGSR